jgi:hypothetical protein
LDEVSRDWLRRHMGRDVDGRANLAQAVVDGLADRVRSLLLSGSMGGDAPRDDAAWANVRGLLLGLTALGTREIR